MPLPCNWFASGGLQSVTHFGLVSLVWFGFHGIWTILSYLTPNPLYTYYMWFVKAEFVDNIFNWARTHLFAYSLMVIRIISNSIVFSNLSFIWVVAILFAHKYFYGLLCWIVANIQTRIILLSINHLFALK